jgi:hypothetical protein
MPKKLGHQTHHLPELMQHRLSMLITILAASLSSFLVIEYDYPLVRIINTQRELTDS